VTGWLEQSRQARAPPPWRAAASRTKKVKIAQGTVKWFNGDKGYGFITVEAARTCSCTSARSPGAATAALEEGRKVEFDITQGQKGSEAENVRVIG
jgi:cold shock protein